jgi:CHAD domain-containing protein
MYNFICYRLIFASIKMDTDYIRLKEIKPALAGYIRESLIMLMREPVPDEEVIHDVRVLMKKSRAALKLIAPQVDTVYVNKDIIALREVGRKMCSWRECSVLRKSLKELKKDFPDLFSQLAENEKINSILKKADASSLTDESLIAESESINALLRKTGFRIRFQSMNKIDPQLLVTELEQTYKMVVDIYLSCRNNPKQDKLHEFRKKSKDFLYQLYFFKPLNPQAIKPLEKKLDTLTQLLGRFNDLSQLVGALDYEYSVNRYPPAMDELVIRIREKQDRYLSKIWPAAYKIFRPGQRLVTIMGFKLLIL